MTAGEQLQLIDTAGQQVADLFAVAFEPLLTFEADDSPGIHDMLFSVGSAQSLVDT